MLKSDLIKLPDDIKQVPDIFVYLINEANRPVCFTRIKPYAVDKKGEPLLIEGGMRMLGFDGKATWQLLSEDKSIDALDQGEFPGSLLLKFGIGRAEDGVKHEKEWLICKDQSMTNTSYQARVHVYQGRDLPPADSNGLCDPFICVNFMGQQKCTKIVKKNTVSHLLRDPYLQQL